MADDLRARKEQLERVWDFRAAAECAQQLGDVPDAIRLLIDAKAPGEAAQLAAQIVEPKELARAAEVYEKKRIWEGAAALRERLGEFERAADDWGKAQRPLERARTLELAGRPREAGLLLERTIADAPNDAAEARLRLAKLLAAFGRHEEAVRHLQKARPDRLLVRELDALGLREAASWALDRLRLTMPELPETLGEFLAAEPPLPSLADADGRSIAGRYRIVRLVAAGGNGRVYLADDLLTGGPVALKLFAAAGDSRGREAWQRFLREAHIVRALRHPNVVEVRDVDETLGMMVMEYLPGGTLADRFLPRRGLLPAEARRIALEVLAALEAAHQHGVVHRDLKPANILFDAAGTAKLGDFGVAHLVDAGQTQTAGLIGTLAYMSPEQVTGAPITFAADLYALGVTLHEMLTGALPFPGPDFVAQHLGDAPPPTGLGAGWDAIVHRLLEKAPEARFGSIDEARAALAGIAPAVTTRAAATPPPATAPVGPPTERYTDRHAIGATAWSRLFEATDAQLGRKVVLEEFTAPLDPHLDALRILARAGGPHLQRLLRIDAQSRTVVYESVAGPPLAVDDATRVKILRALAPLHAEGRGHGALAHAIVACAGEPVVRIAGLCDPARAATPADDLSVLAPARP